MSYLYIILHYYIYFFLKQLYTSKKILTFASIKTKKTNAMSVLVNKNSKVIVQGFTGSG